MKTTQCALRWLGMALWLALLLPARAQPPGWSYRIQPGDTLIQLAETHLSPRYGWRDLQRHNRVADPLKLPPGGLLRLPIAWLQRETSVARTVHVQGQVELLRPGSATAPLTAGALLHPGDSLRTAARSSVSLRFVDGSRLLVTADSQLSIEELLVHGRAALTSTRLRLERGGADSRVEPAAGQPPHYELRTPSLNLGVRGTEFRVQAEADRTSVQVLSGAVAAGAERRGTATLQSGQGALARAGQAPQRHPLPAPPRLDGLPARLEQLPLQLHWPAQDGASAYRAQVFAEGDFERLLLDGSFPGPSASWPDLPDGRYSLRVRAIDAQGLEGRAAEAGFQLKARPEPPFVRAPAPGAAVYGDRVRLQWSAPLAAQAYRLQLSAGPDFAAPLLDRADLGAAELELPLPPGDYHWRLASIAIGPEAAPDPGPFGPVQRFTLRALPPSPAAMPPALDDAGLLFRWRAQPGLRYELQWSPDPDFGASTQRLDSDGDQARLPRPAAGVYHLRLRAVDAHGQPGPWGGTQRFEVPGSRWPWLLLPLLLLLPVL